MKKNELIEENSNISEEDSQIDNYHAIKKTYQNNLCSNTRLIDLIKTDINTADNNQNLNINKSCLKREESSTDKKRVFSSLNKETNTVNTSNNEKKIDASINLESVELKKNIKSQQEFHNNSNAKLIKNLESKINEIKSNIESIIPDTDRKNEIIKYHILHNDSKVYKKNNDNKNINYTNDQKNHKIDLTKTNSNDLQYEISEIIINKDDMSLHFSPKKSNKNKNNYGSNSNSYNIVERSKKYKIIVLILIAVIIISVIVLTYSFFKIIFSYNIDTNSNKSYKFLKYNKSNNN